VPAIKSVPVPAVTPILADCGPWATQFVELVIVPARITISAMAQCFPMARMNVLSMVSPFAVLHKLIDTVD
jgi:hypothetical protein